MVLSNLSRFPNSDSVLKEPPLIEFMGEYLIAAPRLCNVFALMAIYWGHWSYFTMAYRLSTYLIYSQVSAKDTKEKLKRWGVLFVVYIYDKLQFNISVMTDISSASNTRIRRVPYFQYTWKILFIKTKKLKCCVQVCVKWYWQTIR